MDRSLSRRVEREGRRVIIVGFLFLCFAGLAPDGPAAAQPAGPAGINAAAGSPQASIEVDCPGRRAEVGLVNDADRRTTLAVEVVTPGTADDAVATSAARLTTYGLEPGQSEQVDIPLGVDEPTTITVFEGETVLAEAGVTAGCADGTPPAGPDTAEAAVGPESFGRATDDHAGGDDGDSGPSARAVVVLALVVLAAGSVAGAWWYRPGRTSS